MPLPARLLNQSATLYRPQGRVRDGRGGYKEARPTLVGALSVRVQPAGSSEVTRAGSAGAVVSHVIYALPGDETTTIRRGDQVSADKLYEVVSVERPSERDYYVKALAYELQHAWKPA